MSTAADAPSTTSSTAASSPARPEKRFHWGLMLTLLIAALVILYAAGAFRPRPRIVLVTSDQPYWDLVIQGAQEAADQYDVNLTVHRVKPDVDSQAALLRSLIDQTFDGVAISPIDPVREAAVLGEVAAKHTVVTFDSDSPSSSRLCFVGTDNYAAGRLCGQQVRDATAGGAEGDVIISISNLDKDNARRRRQGVIDELLDRPFKPDQEMDPADAKGLKGPQHTVVATIIDGNDPSAATEMVADALKSHPNVKCIIGLNAYSTPAVLKALEQSGKLGQIQVVGFDIDPATLAGIEQGHVYSTIVQDQFGCGFHAVRILAENARGNSSALPLFQRRTLPVEVVNKANVAAWRGQLAPATQPAT